MNLGIGGGAWKSGMPYSLHDVLDCPPSLRYGEVQRASWMNAMILICDLHL
jgi:hypothetical protein